MAFFRYAYAPIVKTGLTPAFWENEILAKAMALGPSFEKRQATKLAIADYDPNKFLLTHCTIVASVNAEESGLPLGRQTVNGFQIDRKYGDFYISPETAKYTNNNWDAFEKKLTLSSFRTFIGGQNYVEHIQIPELSKGRIIDAVARDIGDSIYVDILVATDLGHQSLVAAIRNRQLTTLSMGCIALFTICTKCGNVAEDETLLCPCVRFQKGNFFYDEKGKKRLIAELCGHVKAEPGSVRFIEASWVGNPAFKGAVLRSILTPEETRKLGAKVKEVMSVPAQLPMDGMAKAANFHLVGQDFGQDEGAPPPVAPGEKVDPLDKIVEDLYGHIKEKLTDRLKKDMEPKKEEPQRVPAPNDNNTLIKTALRYSAWRKIAHVVVDVVGHRHDLAKRTLKGLLLHKEGGWEKLTSSGFTGREKLVVSRVLDRVLGRTFVAGESRIYRTVIIVGGVAPHATMEKYLQACRQVIGRDLTYQEKALLIEKGKIFSQV